MKELQVYLITKNNYNFTPCEFRIVQKREQQYWDIFGGRDDSYDRMISEFKNYKKWVKQELVSYELVKDTIAPGEWFDGELLNERGENVYFIPTTFSKLIDMGYKIL